MLKTTKDLTKRLKLIFEVQEKTSSTLKIPLDQTRQEGDEMIYYFKSLPREELAKRDKGSSRAPLVQLRVRPRLLGH